MSIGSGLRLIEPYCELLYLCIPVGTYRYLLFSWASIPTGLLFPTFTPLLFRRAGGCPTRLLFMGALCPKLFPMWFFVTEDDLLSGLDWTLPALNELFLPVSSYFVVTFFCGASSINPYYFWAFPLFSAISSASSSLLIMILMAFLFCLGNIISLALMSSFETGSWGFLSSFTLSAYLKVLRVFSDEADEGETFPIMTVLQKPMKESLRTMVSLEPLKGVWPFPWSRALIHSLRDSKDLLI